MAVTINADTSNGVIITPDTSGEIELQSAGTDTVTVKSDGKVGINNNSPSHDLHIGTNTSTGTTTPKTISLGGTYSSSAGGNAKLRVWTDGPNVMGFGVSSNKLDYICSSASYDHVFYGGGSETMRIDSGTGELKFNSGYGSVATAYACRAWVNFNGTGTVAIRSSGNVSSITDNGTGKYTVNFATAMPDLNYSMHADVMPSYNWTGDVNQNIRIEDMTTTTCRFGVAYNTGSVRFDGEACSVTVFR